MSTLTTSAVAAFRHEFVDDFNDFVLEVNVLAAGHTQYSNNWKDDLGVQGIAISVALIDGVVSIFAAVGMLTGGAAAGISIPLSIAGMVSAFVYQKWRDAIKDKEYARAERKLERNDLAQEIGKIADLLVGLYQDQLEKGTVKEAVSMAKSLFKTISSEILKNENLDFAALLDPVSLQRVVLRGSPRSASVTAVGLFKGAGGDFTDVSEPRVLTRECF